jgi:PHD/YefM family antitoxin component YafN of YafNO toxin-antitoxin module
MRVDIHVTGVGILYESITALPDLFGARITTREQIAMAIESNSEERIVTYTEAYYEELASEEEIYLEETEEELRAYLLSLVPD